MLDRLSSRTRSWMSTAVRVAVSAGLLWFVVSSDGVESLVENVLRLRPEYFVAAVVLSVVNVTISAWKWGILLRVKGVDHPFHVVWQYYYIGQFFNAFLPTAIGGDTARIYYAYSDLDGGTESVSSVVMERLTGLVAILLLAGGATLVAFDLLPFSTAVAVILISVAGLVVLPLVFFVDASRRLVETVFSGIRFLGGYVTRVYASVFEYRDARRQLLVVLVISVLFRLVLVLNNYVVSLGLGMDLPFVYFLVFVPVTELILFVPVSIQGFGVREASYVYLFTSVGAAAGNALALGVVMQIVLGVVNNLIGGIVYLLYVVSDHG